MQKYSQNTRYRYDDSYRYSYDSRHYRGTYARTKSPSLPAPYVIYASLLVIILLVWFAMRLNEHTAVADSLTARNQPVSFHSVQIMPGDTLSSIAVREMGEDHPADCARFMKEVEIVNGINRDNIHAGNYLVIPRYESSAF